MLRLKRGRRLGLFHVFRDGIDQVNFISAGRKPARVRPRPAAHINNHGGSWWQVAQDQFPGARLFELKPPSSKARGFVSFGVVVNDLAYRIRAHVQEFRRRR
jgi:hypothetical protein